jgi:hypothetical protein
VVEWKNGGIEDEGFGLKGVGIPIEVGRKKPSFFLGWNTFVGTEDGQPLTYFWGFWGAG